MRLTLREAAADCLLVGGLLGLGALLWRRLLGTDEGVWLAAGLPALAFIAVAAAHLLLARRRV